MNIEVYRQTIIAEHHHHHTNPTHHPNDGGPKAGDENNNTPNEESGQTLSDWTAPICKFLMVLVFFIVGAIFYHYNEGWDVLDCVYFMTVTVTTVGYGDFHPTTDNARIFTVFFVIFGISFVFSTVNEFVTYFIAKAQDKALESLDDDPTDDKAPHSAKIFLSIMAIWVCVFVGAGFFMHNEDWTFVTAFYFCVITTCTVGYGDLAFTKESSRLFAIFYVWTSVIVTTYSIGNLVVVQYEIAEEKRREEMLLRKLDVDMIRQFDKDGNGVDKFEFVIGMMTTLGTVDMKNVTPWIKRFEELDTDNSGILDEKDIAEVEIMEKEKMRQLSAKISQLKKDRGTLLGTLNATWSWIAKLVMRKRSTETPKDHESAPQKQSSVISVENPMMTSI